MKKTFNPEEISQQECHKILLSGVAPRPIALVSTVSDNGEHNLSPFSFFNAFGSNPPIIVFSPAYRGTDGKAKDTLTNILQTKECTISAVTASIVEQVNVASSSFAYGVNEFSKSGLTPFACQEVASVGVAESPFIMECKLLQHIETGRNPDGSPRKGSGNLLICQVVRFHVNEDVFVGDRIQPQTLDLVARMGGNWYAHAQGSALFELPAPRTVGIGFDGLPEHIRTSTVLTGSQLAKLAYSEAIPELEDSFDFHAMGISIHLTPNEIHTKAAELIEQGAIAAAWQLLLRS